MPESVITPLDDRCYALETFVETTGTALWHGLRSPSSIRNGYGRSQAAVADGARLKAVIYTPKVQDTPLPFPTTEGVTKQRGKRARAKAEDQSPQRQVPSPRKRSSIHYGVRFRPDLRKWVAEIRVAEWKDVDKKVWLGTFDTEEGAARGVDLARKLLKCAKKRPFNFPCRELELYCTTIPAHLDLTDIANEAMFKDVVQFIKNECQTYAARFPPAATPPVAVTPHRQSTSDPDPLQLGFDLWNELDLSGSDRLLVPTDHPHVSMDVLNHRDVFIDMDEIFDEAFLPFGELQSGSSLGSSAPSSFTGQELEQTFQAFQAQVERNDIARGASPAAWEINTDVAVEPVCHDLAAVYSLPHTWPGAACGAFPGSDLDPEQISPLYASPGDGGDMTFFDFANPWSLQSEEDQFAMDMN